MAEKMASPMFWKSGVISKICTSPKSAEIRWVMKMADDVNIAKQLSILIKEKVNFRVFTDSRSL